MKKKIYIYVLCIISFYHYSNIASNLRISSVQLVSPPFLRPEVEGTLGHAAIIDLLKEVDGNGDGVIDFQVWMVVKGQGNWSRRMGMMNDVLFFL